MNKVSDANYKMAPRRERACACVCVWRGLQQQNDWQGRGQAEIVVSGQGSTARLLHLHNSQRLLENEVSTYKLHPVRHKMEADGVVGMLLLG